MRMGCCGAGDEAANVGFVLEPASAAISLSSESSGAATRSASTSFSNRAISSSFCLKTSYTFFILGTCLRNDFVSSGLDRTLCSWQQFVKKEEPLVRGKPRQ